MQIATVEKYEKVFKTKWKICRQQSRHIIVAVDGVVVNVEEREKEISYVC